jgi:hypothetical protein
MQLSPPSRHLILLRSKYPPQHHSQTPDLTPNMYIMLEDTSEAVNWKTEGKMRKQHQDHSYRARL